MSKDDAELHVVTWRGRDVGIRYRRDVMGIAEVSDYVLASLQVWHLQGQPLPINDCGARTYYQPAGEIEGIGGPVAYAEMWLRCGERFKQVADGGGAIFEETVVLPIRRLFETVRFPEGDKAQRRKSRL